MRHLDDQLRGCVGAGFGAVERRRTLRLAYVDGAEEWSRDNIAGSLTVADLEGVLRRFPNGQRGPPGVVMRAR